MDIAQNEKAIKQYFEYFNSHNWKKMAEMYTETADFKDPSCRTRNCKANSQTNSGKIYSIK